MRVVDLSGRATLVERLEAIRDEAINGLYDRALSALDELLADNPDEIDTLRLKGNVLELRALDFAQYRTEKLLKSRDYVSARSCYEKILALDPRDTAALADLGDHYKNLDAYDRALDYYMQAVMLLKAGESRLGWRDEVQEIADRVADFGGKGSPGRVTELSVMCRELLSCGGDEDHAG